MIITETNTSNSLNHFFFKLTRISRLYVFVLILVLVLIIFLGIAFNRQTLPEPFLILTIIINHELLLNPFENFPARRIHPSLRKPLASTGGRRRRRVTGTTRCCSRGSIISGPDTSILRVVVHERRYEWSF